MSWLAKCGLLVLALNASTVMAADAVKVEPSFGELLYSTNCLGCHTEQAHWRDTKLVADWTSLVREVERWQKSSKLDWNGDSIDAVARYLNAAHYHYTVPPSN